MREFYDKLVKTILHMKVQSWAHEKHSAFYSQLFEEDAVRRTRTHLPLIEITEMFAGTFNIEPHV